MNSKEEIKRLRKFGLIMALMFSAISCFTFSKLNWTFYLSGTLGLFFICSLLLLPAILKPIEHYWLKFGEKMSVVMSYLLLIFTYFLIITPMALLMRFLGKRPLDLRFRTNEESYWRSTEANERYRLPY